MAHPVAEPVEGRASPAPPLTRMRMTPTRATIPRTSHRYMSMKVATQERLRRTAVEAVGSIPGIEAVVLYGSRARGTARATSDWDIAILSHASPENEQAAKRIAGTLRLQTEWLRWYATHNPEMREAAVATGREIADAAGFVEGMRGFDRLDSDLQTRVRTWGDEGRSSADAFDGATPEPR